MGIVRCGRTAWLLSVLLLFSVLGAVAPFARAAPCASHDRVRVQLQWVLQSQFIGYLSALEFGYYGDECLEVAIFPGGPGIISPEFVQKDVAQFGVSWMQPFIASAAVPRDLVLIAQTYQTGGTRAITLKSSGIDTLAKLRGKPVAMWDGVDGELKNALQLEGLIAGVDYTRVSQGYSPVTSFTTGSAVAAMVMTYNELAQMLSAINPATGKLFTMDDLNVFDFNKLGTSIPQDSLFMPRSYLDDPAKLDLAKRFLKATIRGFIKCRFEPDVCTSLLFPNDDSERWQLNEVNKLVWGRDKQFGRVDVDGFYRAVNLTLSLGSISLNDTHNIRELYNETILLQAINELSTANSSLNAVLNGDTEYAELSLRWCLRNNQCSGETNIPYLCTGQERETESITLAPGLTIAFTVLGAVGVALTLATMAVVIAKRKSVVITTASPLFLLIMLVGIGFEYGSIVANSSVVSGVSCTVFMWLLASGYVMFFSSLFSKTHRIYRIFTNKSLNVTGFSDWHVARVIIAALVIEIVLLLCASLIQAPDMQYIADPGSPFTAVSQCVYFPTMLYILLVYKAIITVIGVVLAILVRNIKNDFFNEAFYIGICIYNSGFLAIVCVPVVAFITQPTVRFIIMNLGIFLMSTISLAVLFGPKFKMLATMTEEELMTRFRSQSGKTMGGATTDGSSLNVMNSLK